MKKQVDQKKEMSFIGHLEELRWRLVHSVIAILIVAITAFVMLEWIMDNVVLVLSHKEFITYRIFNKIVVFFNVGDGSYAKDIPINFQSIEMTGQFGTSIFISLIIGLIVSFPYVFYQIWAFIVPGLKQSEKKYARGIVGYGSVLFLFGVCFGYFLVSPLCVQFFGNYHMHQMIQNNFTITSYMSTIASATFASGLFFQLPIVIYISSKLGLITPAILKKYRKHAFIGILILSAIITPPDIISQILVTIPILVLYEIGIYISIIVSKKNTNK